MRHILDASSFALFVFISFPYNAALFSAGAGLCFGNLDKYPLEQAISALSSVLLLPGKQQVNTAEHKQWCMYVPLYSCF